MPEKVLDPLKQVTDLVLLSALAKQGIDKDFVEFTQDYAMPVSGEKGKSPYAKFYRDLNSNKRFMVVSGLPMVDAGGVKIEAGWKVAGINYFAEKNNLFRAKVQGTQVELIIRNDQPDGRKANDQLSYKPQLFLNDIEQTCGQPILLPIDPVNPNYLENTLEWDYGICKRRLRIIEGGVLGSWVFASNPNVEVRIKYNQTGDYRLKLGQFATDNDTEVIPASAFVTDEFGQPRQYPFAVSDSATFYPNAHIETTSVDGYVSHGDSLSWSNLRNAAGTDADDSSAEAYVFQIASESSANVWWRISRGIFLFDTSGLPDDATISTATFSIYGKTKADTGGWTPDANVYSSAPASNTALATGDYDSLGTTAFSAAITYANLLDNAHSPYWNDFAFNDDGIAAISKTGVSKFGTRNASYDAANSAPAWVGSKGSHLTCYTAEQGNGYKPKLVVTYTVPVKPSRSIADKMMAAGVI